MPAVVTIKKAKDSDRRKRKVLRLKHAPKHNTRSHCLKRHKRFLRAWRRKTRGKYVFRYEECRKRRLPRCWLPCRNWFVVNRILRLPGYHDVSKFRMHSSCVKIKSTRVLCWPHPMISLVTRSLDFPSPPLQHGMESDRDIEVQPIALILLSDDMAMGTDYEHNEAPTLGHDKTAETKVKARQVGQAIPPDARNNQKVSGPRDSPKGLLVMLVQCYFISVCTFFLEFCKKTRVAFLYWSRDEAFLFSGPF